MAVLASTDRALATRLEAADAANVAAMAQNASRWLSGIEVAPFAGGLAIFAGVGSPMTHAMGTGMAGTVAEHELERMEAFFRDHGSACLIDLCPLADPSVIAFVQSRPYRVIEFNNVLARRIRAGEEILPVENVRRAGDGDGDLWARVVAEGFSELMPISEDTLQMLRVAGGHSQRWLADGENPRAAAAMGMHSGVALFYADATHISARRRGWQSALIRARLAEAKAAGCDLAVATVLPGSASHRNYERAGFELIYMRVNVMREFGTQR